MFYQLCVAIELFWEFSKIKWPLQIGLSLKLIHLYQFLSSKNVSYDNMSYGFMSLKISCNSVSYISSWMGKTFRSKIHQNEQIFCGWDRGCWSPNDVRNRPVQAWLWWAAVFHCGANGLQRRCFSVFYSTWQRKNEEAGEKIVLWTFVKMVDISHKKVKFCSSWFRW